MHRLHCLPPNSRDIAVIEKFLDSVSWGSECTLCQQVDRDRVWVKVSNLYVLVPTDCKNYPNNLEEVKLASATLGIEPGVIFYGNPTDYQCDEMNYTAHQQGLVVHWIGAKNQLRYIRSLRKLSDGVDLVKMFVDF